MDDRLKQLLHIAFHYFDTKCTKRKHWQVIMGSVELNQYEMACTCGKVFYSDYR